MGLWARIVGIFGVDGTDVVSAPTRPTVPWTPPPPNVTAADFFISYTKVDEQWGAWIAAELEREGYVVLFQPWDFRPGNNFVLMMDRAAQAARTIIVLSRAFLEADFTQPEWARALAEDPRGFSRKLIPVRIEHCAPNGLLKPIIYIDLVGLDGPSAREALLNGIRQGRAKPAAHPTFPGGKVGN